MTDLENEIRKIEEKLKALENLLAREPEALAAAQKPLLEKRAALVRGKEQVVAQGENITALGDPRFRADAFYLPAEPLLGFVEIPAGEFVMGSDPTWDREAEESEYPQHVVNLPRYFIARYPVTVAQFKCFIDHSGYEPEDKESLCGDANQPVVNVIWQDAVRYCDWLTQKLREWPDTPEPLASLLRKEHWQVILPSEAEWEKAARGTDGRAYPWGDEFDAEKANTSEAQIGAPSAVGCFPAGASPYGVLDMSGNVWEWTRSLWGQSIFQPDFKYPYQAEDGRENLQASVDGLRCVRGGSFSLEGRFARCAYRYWYFPLFWDVNFGFRVAVSPPSAPEA